MKTPLPMIAAQLLAFAVLPASPALAIVLTAAALVAGFAFICRNRG